MADQKISALTSATLPLAGTEVLPIVQSSTTVKVAVDNLTVKNVRSNATTGLLQVTGPGAGTTRVMTTPNANFTAARTDAAQSFTGDQTLSTGNVVMGTAGKGVDFSANGGDVLDQYDVSTPTITVTAGSGSLTTVGGQVCYVTKIGNRYFVNFSFTIVTNGTGASYILVSGLPAATQIASLVGNGMETAVSAKGLCAGAVTSSSVAVKFADGTYPGADGAVICCFLSYI